MESGSEKETGESRFRYINLRANPLGKGMNSFLVHTSDMG